MNLNSVVQVTDEYKKLFNEFLDEQISYITKVYSPFEFKEIKEELEGMLQKIETFCQLSLKTIKNIIDIQMPTKVGLDDKRILDHDFFENYIKRESQQRRFVYELFQDNFLVEQRLRHLLKDDSKFALEEDIHFEPLSKLLQESEHEVVSIYGLNPSTSFFYAFTTNNKMYKFNSDFVELYCKDHIFGSVTGLDFFNDKSVISNYTGNVFFCGDPDLNITNTFHISRLIKKTNRQRPL